MNNNTNSKENEPFPKKDRITNENIELLFKVSEEQFNSKMKLCIHLEPYDGRSAKSTYALSLS